MAKAPTTPHARAIGALINLKITPTEYRECVTGFAWVSGAFLHTLTTTRNGWPAVACDKLPTPGALDLRRAKGVM